MTDRALERLIDEELDGRRSGERVADAIDDDVPVGELVERALGGARDLATQEAQLAMMELEAEGRAVQRALMLSIAASTALAAAIAWGGVAFALALSLGAGGIAMLALVAAVSGGAMLFGARRLMPRSVLGEARGRLEKRAARVSERLR